MVWYRGLPIRAMPATEPIESSELPTPAVSVTSSHCPTDIAGIATRPRRQ
ncbi:MAG TPA: hypothetical protein VF296_00175 [Gallionella sp.]